MSRALGTHPLSPTCQTLRRHIRSTTSNPDTSIALLLEVTTGGFAAVAVDKGACAVVVTDGRGGNLLAVDVVIKQAAVPVTGIGLTAAFFAGGLTVAKAVAVPLPAYFNRFTRFVLTGFLRRFASLAAARRWQAVMCAFGLIVLLVKDVGGRFVGQR